ncbi:MAG: alkaline phosphatase [Rickettsiaceae bacterium]|jgi:Na+/proline symporter/signal transduction histidine kinase|nr:alkaline phosphatase [Rickettsiaceae bacterium]
MNFNIDSAIFIGFLIVNLILGLASSRGVKNIKEYAIGDRNFSTVTIAATLVATWVSGSDFFTYLSEAYNNGLYFIWAATGDVFCLLLVGFLFAPRLGEFLGKLSIAEAMGVLYGKQVRVITAIAGCIGAGGIIAVQLKVAGLIFNYSVGISEVYGIIIGGAVIAIYSSLGGIKSVTFTDVIQLFTFGTVIPTIAFIILQTVSNMDTLTTTLQQNPLFNYHEVFDFTRDKSFSYLLLFFFIAVPGFNPAIFQRIAMAKNTLQVRRAFIIAGFTCLFITFTMSWIGVLTLSIHPDLEPREAVKHIIFSNAYAGFKGLTLAGIMAMIMSTADSYVNSTSVLFVHDFCKPLNIEITKNELTFSRIASFAITIFAIILALSGDNLLNMIIITNSFYLPIVTVPFILAIFGFRSSGKSVLIGMAAGLLTVLLWKAFLQSEAVDSVLPAMLANLIFLLSSHYLLRQPGGWVGIKDNSALIEARKEREKKLKNCVSAITNFNLLKFLRSNSLPNEAMYAYFGLFCMISIYSTMHTISKEVAAPYQSIISFIYTSVLFMSTILISYPLWLDNWKQKNIMPIFWNICVFYILICIGFMLVIMSNFAPLQLMSFMLNLIVIAVLVRWQWALLMMCVGLMLTTQFFKFYLGVDSLPANLLTAEFESVYLLLLVSGILMIFLKPKQQYQELTEEQNAHLNDQIVTKIKETQEALALKAEFIRNVNHEYHAPMTGVISMAEVLVDSYHKLNDQQRLSAAEVILKSSRSLKAFDDNITTLSRLSKPHYELNKEDLDFSSLVYDRIGICRRLYEENKEDREFILDIKEDVMSNVDRTYMTQLLDNLIINSINYCKKGRIKIILSQDEDNIHFVISDTGIGIPKNELYEIFEPFTVSSKTRTPAEGRGVGLAVCKRILEVHGGTIKAESEGEKGATFTVTLPL